MADVASLTRRLDELKARKARAQGTIDNIRAQWKADLGVDTLEEVQKIKETTEQELADLQKEYEALMGEAECLIASAEAV